MNTTKDKIAVLAFVLVSLAGLLAVHLSHHRDSLPEEQTYDHAAEMRVIDFINGDRHWVDADDLTRVPAYLRDAALNR
jgi:hypothetical protein